MVAAWAGLRPCASSRRPSAASRPSMRASSAGSRSGIIEQGFDALGDVGRQQVGGFADQGVQLGNKGRADMVNLLADDEPPADARWRTVRVGVPETQQFKS